MSKEQKILENLATSLLPALQAELERAGMTAEDFKNTIEQRRTDVGGLPVISAVDPEAFLHIYDVKQESKDNKISMSAFEKSIKNIAQASVSAKYPFETLSNATNGTQHKIVESKAVFYITQDKKEYYELVSVGYADGAGDGDYPLFQIRHVKNGVIGGRLTFSQNGNFLSSNTGAELRGFNIASGTKMNAVQTTGYARSNLVMDAVADGSHFAQLRSIKNDKDDTAYFELTLNNKTQSYQSFQVKSDGIYLGGKKAMIEGADIKTGTFFEPAADLTGARSYFRMPCSFDKKEYFETYATNNGNGGSYPLLQWRYVKNGVIGAYIQLSEGQKQLYSNGLELKGFDIASSTYIKPASYSDGARSRFYFPVSIDKKEYFEFDAIKNTTSIHYPCFYLKYVSNGTSQTLLTVAQGTKTIFGNGFSLSGFNNMYPLGTYLHIDTDTAPSGWVLADGRTLPSSYAEYRAKYPDGKVRDMRGRFLMSAQSGVYNRGTTGGATTAALTEANNAPHFHLQGSESIYNFYGGGQYVRGGIIPVDRYAMYWYQNTSTSGSGTSFSILNPYLALPCYCYVGLVTTTSRVGSGEFEELAQDWLDESQMHEQVLDITRKVSPLENGITGFEYLNGGVMFIGAEGKELYLYEEEAVEIIPALKAILEPLKAQRLLCTLHFAVSLERRSVLTNSLVRRRDFDSFETVEEWLVPSLQDLLQEVLNSTSFGAVLEAKAANERKKQEALEAEMQAEQEKWEAENPLEVLKQVKLDELEATAKEVIQGKSFEESRNVLEKRERLTEYIRLQSDAGVLEGLDVAGEVVK